VPGEEIFSPEAGGDCVSLLQETPFLEVTEGLRHRTRRRTPFGDEEFVGRIEAEVERSLVRRPRGRPKRRTQ